MSWILAADSASLTIWEWLSRYWAAIAIALTCLSLAVFLILLLAKYVRICLTIFVDTPPPLSMGPLDFQPLHGEVVRFRSFDGTSLRGMHLKTPNRSAYKGTIVFCHEFGSDMHSCARYSRPLIEAGFDVFTFDYRGHGQSSCGGRYRPLQWPSDKELEDTLGACAHVENVLAADGRPTQIGVFGISRGAGAALLAASSDANIQAIICDGAFSTDTTIIALMKRWAHIFARVKLVYENHTETFWRFLLWLLMRFAQPKLGCRFPSVRKALKEMRPRAIFFIHGQRDSYIREDQTRLLCADAPEPKYLWIVPDAKHNQSVVVHPKQYAARTAAFFLLHLYGEAVDESQITSPAVTEVA
ncbi:MAG TPA: alpha/beta fold hydrolase [Phycisphaerae bacterium]|nr:alpha/beta fold hydrolase [Phycisphaerae bacterium]